MADEASIVSIIGSCRRTNRWRIAADTSVKTLFGHCYLDMRDAECTAKLIEMDILSIFANVTIIVPEGCDVRPSGAAFLGSFSCLVPQNDKTCKLPPIEIDSTTILGRLRVATIDQIPTKKKRWWHRNPIDVTEIQNSEVSQPVVATPSIATVAQRVELAAPQQVDPELPDFPEASVDLGERASEPPQLSDDGAPTAPIDIVDNVAPDLAVMTEDVSA